MNTIIIPAETWEQMAAEAYSGSMIMEQEPKLLGQKKEGLYAVKAVEFKGFLYTSFGTCYCGYKAEGKRSTIYAYRLLPESMYSGETTTVYHDEEAIQAGLRKRGDHTGFLVTVRGKRLVCAESVQFILDLPNTKPIPLATAQAFDEEERRMAWRSILYRGAEIEWFSLNRHPVARYKKEGFPTRAILFWSSGKRIQQLSLGEEVALSPPELAEQHQDCPIRRPVREEQMSLFG